MEHQKKIPDSLAVAYTTRNGRTVYDRGGIEPDIEIESKRFADISLYLLTKYMFFDFATIYAANHDSIPPVKDFSIDDKIYSDFKNFLTERDFTYSTFMENELSAFTNYAKQDPGFENVENKLEELKQLIINSKEDDLEEFSKEIKQILNLKSFRDTIFKKEKLKLSWKMINFS